MADHRRPRGPRLYDRIVDADGTLDTTRTAFALREVLDAVRADRPDRPDLWASHVHFGP